MLKCRIVDDVTKAQVSLRILWMQSMQLTIILHLCYVQGWPKIFQPLKPVCPPLCDVLISAPSSTIQTEKGGRGKRERGIRKCLSHHTPLVYIFSSILSSSSNLECGRMRRSSERQLNVDDSHQSATCSDCLFQPHGWAGPGCRAMCFAVAYLAPLVPNRWLPSLHPWLHEDMGKPDLFLEIPWGTPGLPGVQNKQYIWPLPKDCSSGKPICTQHQVDQSFTWIFQHLSVRHAGTPFGISSYGRKPLPPCPPWYATAFLLTS